MKKIKTRFNKKELKAYNKFMDLDFVHGQGTGMLEDYARWYIQRFKGDCSPREILESFKSDLDYFIDDLHEYLDRDIEQIVDDACITVDENDCECKGKTFHTIKVNGEIVCLSGDYCKDCIRQIKEIVEENI